MFTRKEMHDIDEAISVSHTYYSDAISEIACSILGTDSIPLRAVSSTLSSQPWTTTLEERVKDQNRVVRYYEEEEYRRAHNKLNVIENCWEAIKDRLNWWDAHCIYLATHTTVPRRKNGYVIIPISYDSDISAYKFNGITDDVVKTFNTYIVGFCSHISDEKMDTESAEQIVNALNAMTSMDGYDAYMEVNVNGVILVVYREKGREYLTYEVHTKPIYEPWQNYNDNQE